jgi:hypothetical protein
MSILFSSQGFKFCERLAALCISFCSLIDQFLIAPSGALRSLDGFWVFSEEIEVDHPSRIQGINLRISRRKANEPF